MAQVISTNIMSLNAQRNLNTSSASLASSVQRLSSGLRINSAKDDAAGLAISERFTTQIRGMEVAARNANDGISLAQTAEGALSEIGNNLQRIRELAVQSRNATNSDSDRQALNAEVDQLKAEIQRVAEHTDFNGTKLLDGSFQNATFQVGANQGQTIAVNGITNASTTALGTWSADTTTYSYTTDAAVSVTKGAEATSFSVNGVAVAIDAKEGRSEADAKTALIEKFNEIKAKDSKLANVEIDADGKIKSTDATLKLEGLTNVGGIKGGTFNGQAETVKGQAQVGFAKESVLTTEAADRMIMAMDAALNSVNSTRADLGAVQNRFTSVVANLNSTAENLSASRSRIRTMPRKPRS